MFFITIDFTLCIWKKSFTLGLCTQFIEILFPNPKQQGFRNWIFQPWRNNALLNRKIKNRKNGLYIYIYITRHMLFQSCGFHLPIQLWCNVRVHDFGLMVDQSCHGAKWWKCQKSANNNLWIRDLIKMKVSKMMVKKHCLDSWEAYNNFRLSPTPKYQKIYSNESKVIPFVTLRNER